MFPSFLRLLVYNIISAGGNNLNMVLRAMNHMHIDLGFLTETKLSHDKYTRNCEGYAVYSTRSDPFKGGVALFYRNSPYWTIEGIQPFGPNVLRCSLVCGNRRWTCLGIYIPPSDSGGDTLHWIELATQHISDPLILLGDLNCDLSARSLDSCADDLHSLLSHLNLTDVANHFTHPRGRWTWSQWRTNRYIRSTTDYVLAQRPLEFSRWVIKIPRYHSDHRALVVELMTCSQHLHRRYYRQYQFPIQLPRPLARVDQMFDDLCKICRSPARHRHCNSSWISQATWRMIADRAALVRRHRFHHHVDDEPVAKRTRSHSGSAASRFHLLGSCREHCVSRLRVLSHQIRASLRTDRKHRAASVALEAERYLQDHQVHEAFRTIQGWYRSRSPLQSKPLWIDLQRLSQEYETLYSRRPIVGRPLLVEVAPYDIPDTIPDEAEIRVALHRLRKRRAAGPSGMTVESLLDWEHNCPQAWSLLIKLVQTSFSGYEIPLAYSHAILVLLPKTEFGKFRGITLLEVLYKLWSMIVYLRALKVIKFHPGIHGFRSHRGCDTAILEAKLEMQWAAFQSLPYFQIFLDLTKAYDSIDRDKLLDILAAYGFGPNTLRFLRRVWANAQLVLRQMGYYGSPFGSDRGIWQGCILSPLFLNIILDCILRRWDHLVGGDQIAVFYADDGRIAGFSRDTVQKNFTLLLDLLARIGLFPNAVKTKAMLSIGHRSPDTMSSSAFKRRYDCSLPTHRARKLRKVQCPHCHKSMNDQYLPTHIRHLHHVLPCVRAAPPCDSSGPTKRRRLSYTLHVPTSSDIHCPVPDCPTYSSDLSIIRRHFCIRHPTDQLELLGGSQYTQCPRCGLLLTSLTPQHFQSQFCLRQSTRRERILSSVQSSAIASDPFVIGTQPIDFVDTFQYLGRILSCDDSDDMAAFSRLQQARQVWGRFSTLLQADGASVSTMSRFYQTVIQQTLLFGSATWVLSQRALGRLERFHARCARGMAHRPIQRRANGTWITPPTAEVLTACHLEPISVYIQHRRHTLFSRYAASFSRIYQRCMTMGGTTSRSMAWWLLPDTRPESD